MLIDDYFQYDKVAPPAGAWIETSSEQPWFLCTIVAPPAGAWIETDLRTYTSKKDVSPLLQGRGLKHFKGRLGRSSPRVAPPAGAWIETIFPPSHHARAYGRPSCRGVD